MPFSICTFIITYLVKNLNSKVDADFIIDQYLPVLGEAVKDISPLTRAEKSNLVHKFFGMLIKILFAFVW